MWCLLPLHPLSLLAAFKLSLKACFHLVLQCGRLKTIHLLGWVGYALLRRWLCGPSQVLCNCWLSCTEYRLYIIFHSVLFHFLCYDILETWNLATFHSPAMTGWLKTSLVQAAWSVRQLAPHLTHEAWHQLPPPSSSNKARGFFHGNSLHSNGKVNKDTSVPHCSLPLPCRREKGAY